MELSLNSRGYIARRESFDLEFKQSFHFGDPLIEYVKTLVGMANNRGGNIVFGIQDNPRIPIGLKDEKFHRFDPKNLNQKILEYFSSDIEWNADTTEINDIELGVLSVKMANNKPIICKKTKDKILREGAIYYRYRGETKEIQYSDLNNLLKEEKEKEKKFWKEHIEKIAKIGPQNIEVIDVFKGEIHTSKTRVLIDKNILDKIKFIKAGNISKEKGAPTLKIIGHIEGIVDSTKHIASDILYPLLRCDLMEKLNLTQYEIQCIIWKLCIKEKSEYHTSIRNCRKGKTMIHKYSESLIPYISRLLKDSNFIEVCKKEYKKDHSKL